jgi:hypothetical protein
MRKQTNTLSPSPKGFQSPKFTDSDFREVCGLGRPKSSAFYFAKSRKTFDFFFVKNETFIGDVIPCPKFLTKTDSPSFRGSLGLVE